jgi:hypothetical protein
VKGRRLPDGFDDRPEFTWAEVLPGDYWKRRDGSFYLNSPDGEHGAVNERWTVIEHEDGTITVSPSIWFNTPRGWHGFLKAGIWSKA